jgi:hypothetical protein
MTCECGHWDVVDVITEVESTRKARPLKAAAMDRARELHVLARVARARTGRGVRVKKIR